MASSFLWLLRRQQTDQNDWLRFLLAAIVVATEAVQQVHESNIQTGPSKTVGSWNRAVLTFLVALPLSTPGPCAQQEHKMATNTSAEGLYTCLTAWRTVSSKRLQDSFTQLVPGAACTQILNI